MLSETGGGYWATSKLQLGASEKAVLEKHVKTNPSVRKTEEEEVTTVNGRFFLAMTSGC